MSSLLTNPIFSIPAGLLLIAVGVYARRMNRLKGEDFKSDANSNILKKYSLDYFGLTGDQKNNITKINSIGSFIFIFAFGIILILVGLFYAFK
jgi:hypothetical protein